MTNAVNDRKGNAIAKTVATKTKKAMKFPVVSQVTHLSEDSKSMMTIRSEELNSRLLKLIGNHR